MVAGGQSSWSGRGAVEAVAGDLITVNPGEVHDGAPLGDSRTWTMLYIAPQRMAAIVLDIRDGRSADLAFTDPVLRDPPAAGRFKAAYAALTGGAEGDQADDERLILLVAGLLSKDVKPAASTPRSLICAKHRIDDDPAGPHSLDDLASLAGLGRFQALRGFAKLTGLTPHAYVVQRRLDLARAMIREGTALADAAVATGFSDQSHFHRAFTSRYGLTPGAYAAAMR